MYFKKGVITSEKVVGIALALNLIMLATKGLIAWLSGSSAMFSEALHSLADSTNSVLLLVGLKTALKPPDRKHPFGHGKSVYFWSLIAAIFMFGGTSVSSMVRGYIQLHNPTHITYIDFAIIILVFSLLMELLAVMLAVRAIYLSTDAPINCKSKLRTFVYAFKHSEKPTVKVVFVEELAAFCGVLIALIAIVIVNLTGFLLLDAYAAVAIGMILSILALYLANENRSKLLMEAASPRIERAIRTHTLASAHVRDIVSLKTMRVGTDKVLVSLVVELDPEMHVESMDDVVANVEKKIISEIPEVIDCFIEVIADTDITPSAKSKEKVLRKK